jgi:hypothetical protein
MSFFSVNKNSMKRLHFLLALLLLVTTSTSFVEDSSTSADVVPSDEFVYNFYEAMNAIVNDFPNNFQNIMGDAVSKEDSNSYQVNVELPGAKSASIGAQLNLKHKTVENVYTALLYKGYKKKYAKKTFKGYQNMLRYWYTSCCKFSAERWDGSAINENEKSYVLFTDDKTNAGFENLGIHLRIYPFSSWSEEKDIWTVVLNIRRH